MSSLYMVFCSLQQILPLLEGLAVVYVAYALNAC